MLLRCLTILFLSFIFPFNLVFATVSLEEANIVYKAGDYQGAREAYEELASYNKSAYLELATLHKELGKYSEAVLYLNCYLKENPLEEQANLLLGQVLYLWGDSKEAGQVLRKLEKSYKNYLIYVYLGLIYEDLRQESLAVRFYKKSLKYSTNTISLYRLAKIFYHKNNYRKAIDYFENLIAFDASVRIAYYYLGDCYMNDNNFIRAYKYLSQAKNFYPANREINRKFFLAEEGLGKEYFQKKKEEILKERKEFVLVPYRGIEEKAVTVSLGILKGVSSFSFKLSGRGKVSGAKKSLILEDNKLYTIETDGGSNIYLLDYETSKRVDRLTPPLVLTSPDNSFYILGTRQGTGQFWQKYLDMGLRGRIEIISSGGVFTVVNVISLEEYLYGVLPTEIYSTAGMDGLKAQAVAARTIALRNLGRHQKEAFDLCCDVHCQVYGGTKKELSKTNKAVDETRGEVMFFQGKAIEAFYHSNCGGCLRGDLFGERGYLENKLDRLSDNKNIVFSPWQWERWFKDNSSYGSFCSYTQRRRNYRWQIIYDEEDFSVIFGWRLNQLKGFIAKRGECGHIDVLTVKKEDTTDVIKGDLTVRNYLGHLRSSAFKIEVKYTQERDSLKPHLLIIWGAGFGHGVGMCQEGAEIMAKQGYNYREILQHYYKRIEIKNIYQEF
ncbi:MAG: SpoIID/LytB domain-containing protein [Candidatus Omnitrophota bacterium]